MSHLFTENLISLLGSRICHDLISPIGAVSNGLELLSLSGVPDSAEMTLVSDSAANANARIKLFRLAFGIASQDQITRRDEITSIWPNAMAGRRLDLNWHGPNSLPRPQAQLIVLALLCLDKMLPQGGVLSLTEDADTWTLTASGPALKTEDDHWALVTGTAATTAEPDPAYVQFLLLPYYLTRQNRQAKVTATPDMLTLTF